MRFTLIDMDKWERREHYNLYMNKVVCGYSMTVDIDISNLQKEKLYPAMIWLIADTVNAIQEFRTCLQEDGLGVFEKMHPSYTIFNKENNLFSEIYTEFDCDYKVFLQKYNNDLDCYATKGGLSPKPGTPNNTFHISMLPWMTFNSFNLNIQGQGGYLLPIFTMGKKYTQGGKTLLPLAIQVHHAVCDGYHVGVFLEKLQDKINKW